MAVRCFDFFELSTFFLSLSAPALPSLIFCLFFTLRYAAPPFPPPFPPLRVFAILIEDYSESDYVMAIAAGTTFYDYPPLLLPPATTYYLLPTTYYLLPTAYCLLPTQLDTSQSKSQPPSTNRAFRLTCSGWEDALEDLPLSYAFFHVRAGKQTHKTKKASQKQKEIPTQLNTTQHNTSRRSG